jgi:hypothetical protein
MNRKIAYSALIILIALGACNSYSPEQAAGGRNCAPNCLEKNSVQHQLAGNWNWVETSYFSEHYGQLIKTPQNTGKKLTYTFTDDTLIISSDGAVIEKNRYEIGTLKDITHFSQDTTLIIRLFDAEKSHKISLLHFCGEDMIIVNSYNNLGGNVKLRKEG